MALTNSLLIIIKQGVCTSTMDTNFKLCLSIESNKLFKILESVSLSKKLKTNNE
jgi:hypothetical protein